MDARLRIGTVHNDSGQAGELVLMVDRDGDRSSYGRFPVGPGAETWMNEYVPCRDYVVVLVLVAGTEAVEYEASMPKQTCMSLDGRSILPTLSGGEFRLVLA